MEASGDDLALEAFVGYLSQPLNTSESGFGRGKRRRGRQHPRPDGKKTEVYVRVEMGECVCVCVREEENVFVIKSKKGEVPSELHVCQQTREQQLFLLLLIFLSVLSVFAGWTFNSSDVSKWPSGGSAGHGATLTTGEAVAALTGILCVHLRQNFSFAFAFLSRLNFFK